MLIQNPTAIDSYVFGYVMQKSLSLLGTQYYGDLYYNAQYIERIFQNWETSDDMHFFLIVRRDRTHLTRDPFWFHTKRIAYFSDGVPYMCYRIDIAKTDDGWQLSGSMIDNRTGKIEQPPQLKEQGA